MIALFTDFGLHGPYTGQMKAVLHQMAPGIPAIDLFADAPVGNPKALGYLLAVYAGWFQAGTVFLCVVEVRASRWPSKHCIKNVKVRKEAMNWAPFVAAAIMRAIDSKDAIA
jgi:hypothetical protein